MTTHYSFAARSATDLVHEVERAVRDGVLAPGQRLPSVRALAEELGISPSTVAAAFAELRRRAVVITQDRSGTRINDRPPIGAPPPAVVVPASARDLATGNPDPALLPDPRAAITRSLGDRPRLYGADPSLPRLVGFAGDELRAALPGRSSDIELDAVVVSGALDGVERTLAVALPPGASVAIEDPGYDSLLGLVRALGLRPIPVPVDESGPRPDGVLRALDAGAAALVATCRAQNPTGSAVSPDRADELRAVIGGRPDLLLIENDHLGDIADAPLCTLVGATRRWAHVRSYAKSLGPDLRVAVLLGDPDTIDQVAGRQALGPGWVSELLQRTTVALLADPRTPKLLDAARTAYRTRRRSLLDALAARGVPATGRSGFNVWVPVADEAAAVATLLDGGWAVAGGARYRQAAPPGVRITTSDLRPDEAERIAGLLRTMDRPRRHRSA